MSRTTIYGKDNCPYTRAAREAYQREGLEFDYFDVTRQPDRLQEMLRHTEGSRKVPVIVQGDQVIIGYGGT